MPTLQTSRLEMIEYEPKPLANSFMDQRSFEARIEGMEIDNGLDIENIDVIKHQLHMKKKINFISFFIF
jgi:hypothetical protein